MSVGARSLMQLRPNITLHRTKYSRTYQLTKDLPALQLRLRDTNLESTVCSRRCC